MENKNNIEEITRIARENISIAEDAGYGMFNFYLELDKPIQGNVYDYDIILQTYPYKNNDCYGLVYLLCYYPLDDKGFNWEHEDYDFNDLTIEEQEYILKIFKQEMEKANHVKADNNTKLSNFVKKDITFDEKVHLISLWEEDRGSDGEYVYDLDDDDDAWRWKELYDLKTLYKCRAEGRYWIGGWQFECNGLNTEISNSTAWCITNEKMETFFTDNNLLGEIADRFDVWMKTKTCDDNEGIEIISKVYGNLIDFSAYKKAQTPTTYKWVAISYDKSYMDESVRTYTTKEDCYKDMRNSALEKMKWNTEYEDVTATDCDGGINYEVNFYPDRIILISYSGTYMFKIIPTEDFADTKEFWDNLVIEED